MQETWVWSLLEIPEEGNGNTLHYSCLGNSMDKRAWWATIHEVAKSQAGLLVTGLHYWLTLLLFFFFLTHSLLFEVQCILTAELFKILRNDSARSISANLENSSVSTGLGKISFHSSSKEGQCQEYSNYHTFVLISRASEVMPNILQARLQQYLNWGHPDVQAGFRKGRETRDQIINIGWIMQKAREFQKIIYFCFVDYTSILTSILTILLPLTMWITTNYENS